MDFQRYNDLMNTIEKLKAEVRRLSETLAISASHYDDCDNENTDNTCSQGTSEYIDFPQWFIRSPYSRELPYYPIMTEEEIESRDRFINEWDLARFKLIDEKRYKKTHSIKRITADPICFPKWFVRSPYSRELPYYSVMTDEEIETRDRFTNEWDTARFAFENIKHIKEILKHPTYWGSDEQAQPWPEIKVISIPPQIVKAATDFSEEDYRRRKIKSEEFHCEFIKVIKDIFELESIVLSRGMQENDNYHMEDLIDQIVYWLDDNIEGYKSTKKWSITKYAEYLQEKIYDYGESEEISLNLIKELMRDIECFEYRVCKYFGYSFKKIKDMYGLIDNQTKESLYEHIEEYCIPDELSVPNEIDEDNNVIEFKPSFFELSELNIKNLENCVLLTLYLVFDEEASANATVVPVSITVEGKYNNTTKYYNRIYRKSDSEKVLNSFLMLNVKTERELYGRKFEIVFFTSEMYVFTAVYRCNNKGTVILHDIEYREMNNNEKIDYKSRMKSINHK